MKNLPELLAAHADDCEHPAKWAVPELAPLLRAAKEEIERLRNALHPFAEIARRNEWDRLPDDAPGMHWHIVDAPADDIAPGAAYVLHVSELANAAKVLDK